MLEKWDAGEVGRRRTGISEKCDVGEVGCRRGWISEKCDVGRFSIPTTFLELSEK